LYYVKERERETWLGVSAISQCRRELGKLEYFSNRMFLFVLVIELFSAYHLLNILFQNA
jgi:hypothetical protein